MSSDTERVLDNASRDLHRLGNCKKMLASPGLIKEFRGTIKNLYPSYKDQVDGPRPQDGQLYFQCVPVIECAHLDGLEYAFVKYD